MSTNFDFRAPPDYSPHHQSHLHYTAPSLTATITIVLLVFFFASFFSIYLCRFFMGYLITLSNFRRTQSGIAAVEPPSAAAITITGLDPSIIATFPTLVYSSVKDIREDNKCGLECAVCLSEFEDSDELRLLTVCNHVFHPECIDVWFGNHTTCPLCRRSLLPPPENNNENTDPPPPLLPDQNHDQQQQEISEANREDNNSVSTKEDGQEDEVVVVVVEEEEGDHRHEGGATTSGGGGGGGGGGAIAMASLDGGQEGREEEVVVVERFSRCHTTGHSIIHVEPDDDDRMGRQRRRAKESREEQRTGPKGETNVTVETYQRELDSGTKYIMALAA
ncbi:RING-H2 finger protein ATL29-like [Macadamia integrifolia]|uniref:RING-H2 finger protein ATL29-like n=1 Tax=Macadamia integrifolia TaxID=60698 RepID=UPI001C5016C5|nr:RING-H2 finger protein ATL29-like [Macadamia integrifolia]